MNENSHQHSVRRIVLPSGRTIEVVRFQEAETEAPHGLHICPSCESELVQPVAWCEASDGRWELVLSCPNCHWSTDGLFSETEVHALEDKLDQGLADMIRDLQRLTQANMADHVERFTSALQSDLILPEDF
jgi:Zn-finger protein